MGASADNASSNATADDVGDSGKISFALFVEDMSVQDFRPFNSLRLVHKGRRLFAPWHVLLRHAASIDFL
jgi:hypothetical protein